MVYFPSHENTMGQVASGRATQTSLTGFMKMNQRNAIGANGRRARDLKYENVAQYFSWNKAKKSWIPRQSKADAVGRIYAVSFTAGKKFYMRVLLLHCKGYRSFKELQTVNGVKARTYQIACNWLGLLVNDHFYNAPLKKTHPVGLSDTALDTIVRCYVGQACPTGLSDMGSDNFVQCHVEQTWFDGFVRHGIGQLCPILCRTTMFDEFVRHGIEQVVRSHVGQHLSDEFLLIGQIVRFF
jgi:hypothetical protein